MVHRDVKPGNVLLRGDGVTKLADLGIATAADQTRITRSGIVLGTVAYMAPEQLDGAQAGRRRTSTRWPPCCFEALAGRRARSGRTPMEIASAIATQPPPDLRDHLQEAPAAAAEVLRRGLARDPWERPAAAGELGSELRRALERPARGHRRDPSHRADPPAPAAVRSATQERPAVGSRSPWRSAIVAVAAATVALLAAGGGDGDGGGTQRAQQPKADAPSHRGQCPGALRRPSRLPRSRRPRPASGPELNAQGFELMQAGRYEEAVPVLQQAVATWPEDSRDIEYAYALFNLGKSLTEAGDPEAAIPYLEKRLTFDEPAEDRRGGAEAGAKAAGAALGRPRRRRRAPR